VTDDHPQRPAQSPEGPKRLQDSGVFSPGSVRQVGPRVIRSEELLQGEKEVLILHGDQIYRLLRTKNDKLILQK